MGKGGRTVGEGERDEEEAEGREAEARVEDREGEREDDVRRDDLEDLRGAVWALARSGVKRECGRTRSVAMRNGLNTGTRRYTGSR